MSDSTLLLHKSDNEGTVYFAPILHGKLEFAQEVQCRFFSLRPDAIAVEFPKTLETPICRAVRRLPFLSVVLYQEKDGTYVYLPVEASDGLVEAVRLSQENQVPLFFIDRDTEGYPRIHEAMPDSYSIRKIGYSAYCEAYRSISRSGEGHTKSSQDHLREATMAYHLQQIRQQYQSVLFVCGLAHYGPVLSLLDSPQAQPLGRMKRDGVVIANLHENSSREIMSEIPYLAAEHEEQRSSMQPIDRLQVQETLLQEARERHAMNSREEITPQQMTVLRKFARNYALVQQQLTPDFYQLITASRGAVNDNYAYEVWELGSLYPWQDKNPKFQTLELRGEDLYLNQKRLRFHRKFRSLRKRLVPVPVKRRKTESRKGEWQEKWNGMHICSYPPEDVVVEGYGHYIQKKTVKLLAEEHHRTVPFSSSLMDGIDMRETIRNWHEQKLYVMENLPIGGKVGSIVMIFDEDSAPSTATKPWGKTGRHPEEAYPWKMTWLGEHDEESDMAFYATPSGGQVVGPGISRCVYGGFMLTYPPMRVYDIWNDSFFDMAKSKSERLLLSAIDYSEKKLIAYVAAKAPRSWCYSFAERMNKKLVYIPIGQFSPLSLRKIQVFHVLDGPEVRQYAKEYIW
ncbi:MAG: hypothetical protein GY801_29585 [bacterium]|nr:hypothetical protein [bacterium]